MTVYRIIWSNRFLHFVDRIIFVIKQIYQHTHKYKTFTDVDECAHQGGTDGNHCVAKNTKCVNTVGSYVCECLPGYRRVSQYNCVEVDECMTGLHTCHEHAECRNTRGSYQCSCKKGYTGNGTHCKR